ncbi:MAG: hypothetical protein ACLVJH_03140 [Faecalibacterium prausnitzii]
MPAQHLDKDRAGTTLRSSSSRTTPPTRPPLPIIRRREQRYDGLQVVTYPEKGFNFSAINNFGRKYAQPATTCCC